MKALHGSFPRLIFAAIITGLTSVSAQAPCFTPGATTDPTWQTGAQVTVLFDPGAGFTQAQRDAMQAACQNWNAANGPSGNNSGVSFQGFAEGAKPAQATNVVFVRRVRP